MTIYDDYIAYHEQYTQEYGPKTIVFLQVGDFFELYGVQTDKEQLGPDMYAIGDICGLVITRKNKSISENSRSNPLMAGFPLHAFQKQAQALIALNYTIIIIRQVTPPPNVTRKVTEIISPSTFITATASASASSASASATASATTYLMCFLWENEHVGMAGVDLTTGHTWLYEVSTSKTDALEECYRLLNVYTPKEILLCTATTAASHPPKQIEEVIASQHPCVHVQWSTPVHYPIVVQNKVLQKSFPQDSKGLLSPIEQLDLEKLDLARTSLVHLLQFAYQHNDRIIESLQKPQVLSIDKYLTLEYNSAIQLNLISQHPSEKPLLDILNRTHTSLGRRLFRHWLLQPLTDPDAISQRYDQVAKYIHANTYDVLANYLRKIVDLERALRRMILKTFAPMDWIALATSIEAAYFVLPQHTQTLQTIQAAYATTLNLDECAKYNLNDIRTNIFQQGQYPDLDALTTTLHQQFDFFQQCIQQIGKDLCRLESNERDGYYLCMTKKRWETYKATSALARALPIAEITVKPISHTSTILRLQHPKLDAASQSILEHQNKIAALAPKYYQAFVQSFVTSHQQALIAIAQAIAETDVYCTCAKNAVEYNYCRPSIAATAPTHAWFDAKALRHPIIERIQTQVAYVSNDIAMGKNGMLLYGVNSSGKSSFMKAIGLNIIMAQAGMYVAAAHFTYQPYRHIFTRIASTDNLYRGMSSFVVEMTELRTILFRANEFSLVLGDELCAGTESVSALSIVAAGVDSLVEKQATFLFATHLHELPQLLPSNTNVTVAHMHIEIKNNKIIYGRKLQPGKGNPLYGLEVCGALGMPAEFLQQAQQYRRHLTDVPVNLVSSKTSRYNAQVLMEECGICGKPATETHHIQHQEHANAHGFVESGVHVHHPSNLIPLCEECHLLQHTSKTTITGYVQTTEGPEVQVKNNDPSLAPAPSQKTLDIAYFDMVGWKKKTVKGVWRATTWEKIKKHVAVESEEEARAQYRVI